MEYVSFVKNNQRSKWKASLNQEKQVKVEIILLWAIFTNSMIYFSHVYSEINSTSQDNFKRSVGFNGINRLSVWKYKIIAIIFLTLINQISAFYPSSNIKYWFSTSQEVKWEKENQEQRKSYTFLMKNKLIEVTILGHFLMINKCLVLRYSEEDGLQEWKT